MHVSDKKLVSLYYLLLGYEKERIDVGFSVVTKLRTLSVVVMHSEPQV